MHEAIPLVQRNWAETGEAGLELGIDWAQLLQFEALNMLLVVTARCAGALVGYTVVIRTPGMLSRNTIYGVTTVFWLHPDHRRGLNGYRLVQEMISSATDAGVQVLRVHIKEAFQKELHGGLAPLLKRLKMRKVEDIYELRLGT